MSAVTVEGFKFGLNDPNFYTGYTGTPLMPDDVELIVALGSEKERTFKIRVLQASSKRLEYAPLFSIPPGLAKVVISVQNLFNEFSQMKLKLLFEKDPHRSECWNAFKNLVRALISLIPMVNLSLLVFDTLNYAVFMKNSIAKQLEDKTKKPLTDIVAIAINGTVIGTKSIKDITIDKVIKPTAQDYLAYLKNRIEFTSGITARSTMQYYLEESFFTKVSAVVPGGEAVKKPGSI